MPMTRQSLDPIQITSPCTAQWDSMVGNDQVRFCEHCKLSVHNLSAMTRQKAMLLVSNSRGRLCVRFTEGQDGLPVTKRPTKLHRIGVRAGRIAAGAFTAALSVSSAVAQTRQSSTDRGAGEMVIQSPQQGVSTPETPTAANPTIELRRIEELPRRERTVMGSMRIRTPEAPLVDAAFKNDLELLKTLIYAGNDVNIVDTGTHANALVHAVEN